jgi:hypothetical protein
VLTHQTRGLDLFNVGIDSRRAKQAKGYDPD